MPAAYLAHHVENGLLLRIERAHGDNNEMRLPFAECEVLGRIVADLSKAARIEEADERRLLGKVENASGLCARRKPSPISALPTAGHHADDATSCPTAPCRAATPRARTHALAPAISASAPPLRTGSNAALMALAVFTSRCRSGRIEIFTINPGDAVVPASNRRDRNDEVVAQLARVAARKVMPQSQTKCSGREEA